MAPSAIAPLEGSSSSSRPKILIPEKVSPDGLALLSPHFDIDQPKGLSAEELLSIIPQYHGLIIRSETKVTATVLAAAKNLKVVARAGVGVDNVDVEAATTHGIIVVNSPSGNIVAAAEHTIALLMAVARNVPAGDRSLRNGGWERSKLVGTEVGGKTLGIIGLGKVGLKVARMGVGLGMKVVAMDPYASPEIAASANVTLVSDLATLLPKVDFLTIHTPLIASTLDLIGKPELDTMKKTARVLNVARGGVYNEAALLEAINAGTIAGAGLDVFTSEPPAPGSAAEALCRHQKVVATPHLGASTVEAQENVSMDVCAQVLIILKGGLPTSAVNAPLILPEEYRKLQPFVKLVEKMGSLYTQRYSGKGSKGALGGRTFDLVYEGELAGISNTRPLFAALVKGLTSSISDSGGRDVNIVNARLIAKEKGIVVNEIHNRGGSPRDLVYASLVTLRASDSGEGIISGYVSGNTVYISRLDKFSASFIPEGTLLVLHNYDRPGKIGGVGGILGKHGINIRFMNVAALEKVEEAQATGSDQVEEEKEALMILGIEGEVGKEVEDELRAAKGILNVSVVKL
ncbi:D-3-phosphoglycerate dehydrogenase [Venustampulla echinocandica]|uniref:D-3-phosphoglycerate dehydrogenase n=1 Tax=Venustampulla echinocandica TaxID=2656787 RepID=A0A370TNM2_9HELO|nr:D-3-phosphoglycerate dehydrogenase [Venustampulla echinocandica]RDL37114.1 D-3-phosphoglycerate dehydrogenase [Venustampulla echinocandica]